MRPPLFLAAVMAFPQVVPAQVPPEERQALFALYSATGGANWTLNQGWLGPAGSECTWSGVTCDNGAVIRLSLSTRGLTGTLPPEIGVFSHLEYLYVDSNRLYGPIPASIGELVDLIYLRMESNSLSGPIPPELGLLEHLTYLGLASNQLTGSIPAELGRAQQLRTLALSGNGLTGPIPPELGNLGLLEVLNLERNRLSGSIPPEIGSLTRLRELSLGGNRLTGLIHPELGGAQQLRSLDLSVNNLTGPIPTELGNLYRLHALNLERNGLTGSIPPEIGSLTWLRQLRLGGNRLTGGIPPELASLKNLLLIFLQENRLSGTIPSELSGLSGLGFLQLQSNDLLGPIPQEFTRLEALATLNLRYNRLWADDASVWAYLATRNPDWYRYQTVEPGEVTIASVSDHSVWAHWSPIHYGIDPGGYRLLVDDLAGSVRDAGHTSDKTISRFPVTGLASGTSVGITVSTFTLPHQKNPWNLAISPLNEMSLVTTTSRGCDPPTATVSEEGEGFVLSVDSRHDALEWSTGEVTVTITVSPSLETWFWVRAIGPGPCDETAVLSVPVLLRDGFENGNTLSWTNWIER